jgi:hypothetical protein
VYLAVITAELCHICWRSAAGFIPAFQVPVRS